jgi:hypothetical protein
MQFSRSATTPRIVIRLTRLMMIAALAACVSVARAEPHQGGLTTAENTETEPAPIPDLPEAYGEFGTCLRVLTRAHLAPQGPGESNHCLDLWTGGGLHGLLRAAGLTNNHALFINSHGEEVNGRYALYPHAKVAPPGARTPHFSAADVARVLGPEAAAQVHNVLIAGCNAEGAFRAEEFRRSFPNATNVTHTAAGELGYQPMFQQALLSRSSEVETLYESARRNKSGGVEYTLSNKASKGAKKFSPYVAELFRPGEMKPYRTQVAGRELLGASTVGAEDSGLMLSASE